MTAAILSIGDELLIGQVINTNAAWLSSTLADYGMETMCHLSVADTVEGITYGLIQLSQQADLICITGGLGPTKDDITKQVITEYFQDELVFHQETYDRLEKILRRYNRLPTEAHKKQCYLPSKAELLNNEMGTAPGMYFLHKEVRYYFMPGVPHEMEYLFQEKFIPNIFNSIHAENGFSSSTLLTAGIGESRLEEKITDIVNEFPVGLSVAYLPGKAQVRIRLSSSIHTKELIDSFARRIAERLGHHVFGRGKSDLQTTVGKMLRNRGLTLGMAESCTGGLISSKITSVSGASDYFIGTIVCYDNDLKTGVLQVPKKILQSHGAVSEACVRAMASGAIKILGVDVALAISGIAGPTGGTKDKPVGMVWIAVGDKNTVQARSFMATKNRQLNLEYFASFALNFIRLFLLSR